MLQPKTRSMCECVSTSDHDVCSWQKKAAGVACNPADLLQVQQRAAGRLPGAFAGGGERHAAPLALRLLANLDGQNQAPAAPRDPERRNCLPNSSGSVRLQSRSSPGCQDLLVRLVAPPLARNPPLPQARSMNTIFPTGCSKALLVGSIL